LEDRPAEQVGDLADLEAFDAQRVRAMDHETTATGSRLVLVDLDTLEPEAIYAAGTELLRAMRERAAPPPAHAVLATVPVSHFYSLLSGRSCRCAIARRS
jgi:hypothetical protein